MSTLQERQLARRSAAQHKTLAELHPALATRIALVLQDLSKMGWDPVALGGWRSLAQQANLKAEGKSAVNFSFHNATDAEGNPLSMAVHVIDRGLGPQTKDNKDHPFWADLQNVSSKYGLTTGRNWKKPSKDVAHVQLFPNDKLVQIKNWVNNGSIGQLPSLPSFSTSNNAVNNSNFNLNSKNQAFPSAPSTHQQTPPGSQNLTMKNAFPSNTETDNSSKWARNQLNGQNRSGGNSPSFGGQTSSYSGGSLCISIRGHPETKQCFPFDYSKSHGGP